ncbi:vascular endothelial zinc finger 1 isoform X4 [Erythrolamprus reginae]|uniref:vascular endothelial zinc finger 1 isoform X4 n=1 Tax=Erythrolamprus reginae TaxID=121349 RepID=UPI00396CB00F
MEANWTAFLFQAHEASHHQQQAAQNSLLPLLSSAVEPPDQKPILPLPITQKPQPPPETLKDAIVGIKKEKPKTSFVCTYCSKAFRDSYHLRRHESCHTGIKLVSRPKKAPATMVPLISTIAGDNSRTSLVSTIAGILSTVTTSSSATNPSSSAGATAMPGTQTVKKPSKPVKKNHACEMCGKAFRDVYHLNRHKLSHSDEKPFECPICNQRFKRKDRMTYHVRSHEGGITKPYTCGVCGKGFSRPDHLSCHVKHVHSTERPFKCQTCTAAFATKDRLRTHMVRHEGKVSCNICGKLLSAAYITSHLKTHGQSQSINCNTCKQGINKKFGFFKQENLHLPASCMNEESNNQKQQQQQPQQQHVTNWPGKQVETLRLWEEAVKARKKESQQTLRPTSVKQEAANLCQTSTAAPTPVTLSTPFNITSSVASGTITNPVTVAAAMNMRSAANVSSAVNISSPMSLGHPVTITSPLSMTSPLTLTAPVNLPTPVTAPVNIAHPVTITSPMNLPTPMTLAGPLNIAMRPVESMPFLPQALPTSPPW